MRKEDLDLVGATVFMGQAHPGWSAYQFMKFGTPEADVCKMFFPDVEIKNGRPYCDADKDLVKEAIKGANGSRAIYSEALLVVLMLTTAVFVRV